MQSRHVLGVRLPDSAMAREAAQILRDTRSELLFNHSIRVYVWGALAGARKRLHFDPELFYAGAMFHDLGLTERFHSSQLRFELDGANAAREFLRGHGIPEMEIHKVWTAIALHTTPGVPEHMHSEAALLQTGAAMDVAGRFYNEFSVHEREAVTAAYPRANNFGHEIIDLFKAGLERRPMTTVGTFNDDFLAYGNPSFERVDMCSVILNSPWNQQHSRSDI